MLETQPIEIICTFVNWKKMDSLYIEYISPEENKTLDTEVRFDLLVERIMGDKLTSDFTWEDALECGFPRFGYGRDIIILIDDGDNEPYWDFGFFMDDNNSPCFKSGGRVLIEEVIAWAEVPIPTKTT